MRLYNTLTRSEEPFTPGPGNTVRMYTCGLTVYARGHIGNFRTFVCLDVLRRSLKYLMGYDVKQVMNFTDVDDRTIAGAQKAGMDLRVMTGIEMEAAMACRRMTDDTVGVDGGVLRSPPWRRRARGDVAPRQGRALALVLGVFRNARSERGLVFEIAADCARARVLFDRLSL